MPLWRSSQRRPSNGRDHTNVMKFRSLGSIRNGINPPFSHERPLLIAGTQAKLSGLYKVEAMHNCVNEIPNGGGSAVDAIILMLNVLAVFNVIAAIIRDCVSIQNKA